VPFLIGGILLLVFLLVAVRAFVNADPARLSQHFRWFLLSLAGFGAAALIIMLVISERLGPALALMGFLAPIFIRGKSFWRRWLNAAGPTPGSASEVTTPFLRMRLDHDTGSMSGTVLSGRFAGRRLDELSEPELIELWRDCRIGDEESARLMESYLDHLNPNWRDGAAGTGGQQTQSRASDAMSREEAFAILGLEPGADAAQIRDAHRKLMMKIHPDQGGSNYLAAKINRAKEVLIGR